VSLNDSQNHIDPDISVNHDVLWRRCSRNASSCGNRSTRGD